MAGGKPLDGYAISEFIGDFVVYETLKDVFKHTKYDYDKLLSNFCQIIKIENG